MGGRTWLEALKGHSGHRDQGQGTRDVIFADASDNELTKRTKASVPVVDLNAAPIPRREEERRQRYREYLEPQRPRYKREPSATSLSSQNETR